MLLLLLLLFFFVYDGIFGALLACQQNIISCLWKNCSRFVGSGRVRVHVFFCCFALERWWRYHPGTICCLSSFFLFSSLFRWRHQDQGICLLVKPTFFCFLFLGQYADVTRALPASLTFWCRGTILQPYHTCDNLSHPLGRINLLSAAAPFWGQTTWN